MCIETDTFAIFRSLHSWGAFRSFDARLLACLQDRYLENHVLLHQTNNCGCNFRGSI
jgi:hypothetical protein